MQNICYIKIIVKVIIIIIHCSVSRDTKHTVLNRIIQHSLLIDIRAMMFSLIHHGRISIVAYRDKDQMYPVPYHVVCNLIYSHIVPALHINDAALSTLATGK